MPHVQTSQKICGEYYLRFDPIHGKFFRYQYHCHKRDCPHCFGVRRDDWREKVYELARQNGDRLYLTVFDDDTEAQRFKWRVDKHDTLYVRFKATRIYYFHTDDVEDGIKLGMEELDSMNWDDLALTDKGSRASTNVRKEKGTRKSGKIIYVPGIKCDLSVSEVNELWGEAKEKAEYQEPETIEEVQEAVNVITREFVNLALKDSRVLGLRLYYLKIRVSAKPRWSEPQYSWILPRVSVRTAILQ